MKITATGWQRDLGPNKILNREIKNSVDDNSINLNEMSLQKNNDNSIQIQWHAWARLNGDYFWEMRVEKEEIAQLFIESFQDDSLDEILEAMEKKPR